MEKPNDKHYEKAIKEIKDKLEFHFQSIKDLRKKIKDEKYGNNPERERLKKEKDELKAEIEPISKEINSIEEAIAGPNAERKNLKNLKESLQKEIEFSDIKALNNEIKTIQNKLGFANLNVGEEKKLIEKKHKLESQKDKVTKFTEIKDKISSLTNSFKTEFAKLKELKDKRKVLKEKLKKILEKLDTLRNTAIANDTNIKNLELQIENISGEIDKLKNDKFNIENEWNDKWYKYEKQQKELEYINNAIKKITELKKKAEKDKKRQEKMKKEGKTEEDTENNEVVNEVSSKYGYEIGITEWLINYFKSMTADKSTKNETQVTQEVKNDDNKLVPIIRHDNALEVGLSETVSKKKNKGPKVSKRDQKVVNSNLLALDLNIISKIKEINLTPPVFKNDIPAFTENLEKVLHNYVEEENKIMTEVNTTEVKIN